MAVPYLKLKSFRLAVVFASLSVFLVRTHASEAEFDQGAESSTDSSATWLPLSQDQKLSSSLNEVSVHALQRESCAGIIVAKLADQFDSENPKYIVTCEHERGGSFNLVYFQSDVDNGFSTIRRSARPVVSKQEFETLRNDCQEALKDKYGAGIPQLANTESRIHRRGEEHYSLFFDYTEGVNAFALDFTITCVKFPQRTIKVAIFPR